MSDNNNGGHTKLLCSKYDSTRHSAIPPKAFMHVLIHAMLQHTLLQKISNHYTHE
ncbi:hypothetical protein HMPREF3190_00658 [Umbribacter vaginalis]|nr:hypothetical protein HMPREF3190_00658 [Coriobacteriales bacterium DNF00809]